MPNLQVQLLPFVIEGLPRFPFGYMVHKLIIWVPSVGPGVVELDAFMCEGML
jgi:hypothetical protein